MTDVTQATLFGSWEVRSKNTPAITASRLWYRQRERN
uniref:Uncharacterized protein n=1 Tax=Anguilla anguilla TaxID=7936 RepID=A0A0E9UI20_ANGAN